MMPKLGAAEVAGSEVVAVDFTEADIVAAVCTLGGLRAPHIR
jgi:hypothetical protein